MSNLNSSKGSTNVNITKASAEAARDNATQARQIAIARAQNLNDAGKNNAAFSFGSNGEFLGVSRPQDCMGTGDCSAGEACIGGKCVSVRGTTPGNLTSPGDCAIDPAPEGSQDCNGPDGCVEIGVGDCGSDLEGGLNCCGPTYKGWVVSNIKGDGGLGTTWTETWVEQCEPIEGQCDQYADFWYKSTGEIPDGYTAEDICNSCAECAGNGACFPNDFDPPCYCFGQSCRDEEGPCYSCDIDTGDCEKDCADCMMQNSSLFTCNCDPTETIRQANCSINPCTQYGLDGKTCNQQMIEAREAFCKENFPCEDPEDDCIEGCKQLTKVGTGPTCPPGYICSENGIITNEATGESTYFTKACKRKENCGCDADPSSPLWAPCGNCEVCDEGKCVRDPLCGVTYTTPGRYKVRYHELGINGRACAGCKGGWYLDDPPPQCDEKVGGSPSNNFYWWIRGCAGYPPKMDGVNWSSCPTGLGSGSIMNFLTDGKFSFSMGGTTKVTQSCGAQYAAQGGNSGIDNLSGVQVWQAVFQKFMYIMWEYEGGYNSNVRKYKVLVDGTSTRYDSNGDWGGSTGRVGEPSYFETNKKWELLGTEYDGPIYPAPDIPEYTQAFLDSIMGKDPIYGDCFACIQTIYTGYTIVEDYRLPSQMNQYYLDE